MRWNIVCAAAFACPCLVAAQGSHDKPILMLNAGGHTDGIPGLVFTADGKQLLSASRDKTIRVWDVRTGETVRVFHPPIGRGNEGAFRALALAPNGELLAAGGFGLAAGSNPIYLIRLSNGRIERVLEGLSVTALAFSPDGTRLASAGLDHVVRVWDPRSGQALCEHKGGVHAVAFSPDGKHLVAGASDGVTARIWSVQTGQAEATLNDEADSMNLAARGVAWSLDGKTIATFAFDQHLRLWNADGSLRQRIGPHAGLSAEGGLGFTADGKEVLRSDAFYDTATGKERVRFSQHRYGSFANVLSPNGSLVATGGWHGDELSVWRSADASLLTRLRGAGRTNWSAGWDSAGPLVGWGNSSRDNSYDNQLNPLERSFHLADLEFGGAPGDRFSRATTVRDSLSLKRLPRGSVGVMEGGQTIATLKRDTSFNTCWTLIPGKDWAAVGGTSALFVSDIRTGNLVRNLVGHTGHIRALAPSPDGRYLLSAASDQTLRIWDVNREESLLSLFFSENDWVAWTPEGYYAASPGGEKLMGWHVNNGLDKMGAFYPAAQFRASLYRPDVIKLLLEAGSVEKALEMADKARGKKTQFTAVADVLPPFVVITSPDQAKVEVKEPSVEVRFIAKPVGKHPITAVRLLLDGRPYPGSEGLKKFDPPRAGDVRESWTAKIEPGKHTIAVQAESAVSKAVSDSVEINFGARGMARSDDPNDPETRKQALPSLYVLAIGISEYPDKLRLNCAAKDARAIAKACQAGSAPLYRKVEVKLLTDQQATRREILSGLTWLRKQMTQNDVAIISFAGHGSKDADGSFYLLPVDVETEDLLATAVSGDQLKRTLTGMPGRFLLLLDACHSGAVDGEKRRAAGSLTDDLVRDLATDDYGVIVMCSAMGREFALESDALGHGFFTLALVEGLSGKGPKTADGAVYVHHLDGYVTDRVKELTKGRQHPVTVKPGSIRSFPLSKP